jgi:hypothetical protein
MTRNAREQELLLERAREFAARSADATDLNSLACE